MSESQDTRVAKVLENLVGIDAAPHIRGMQREMRQAIIEGRRRAEVDGVKLDGPMKVGIMLFENADGTWRAETIDDVYPGQSGPIVVRDDNERLAMAEFRMTLLNRMVQDRFCREPDARKRALSAEISVLGRVPFLRIVSK